MKPEVVHSFSGIYCIRNKQNGKVYIGKSKNIYKRIHQHIYDLNRQNRGNENVYFSNSWNKYGRDSFEYFVIEQIPHDEGCLKERELYWMDFYNSCHRDFGYNIRRDSSTKMITHEETSLKITDRLKKEWGLGIRDKHGEKLAANWKDNTERKANQSILFSKTLTKYYYLVDGEVKFYKDLMEMGLKNCMVTFHKSQKNRIKFKGVIIERVLMSMEAA